MKVAYRKSFLKDLAAIPAHMREPIERFVFDDLPRLTSFAEAKKIEMLKGYPGCFKARFGSYRVGLRMEVGEVVLERVLHRKEIYRYFP